MKITNIIRVPVKPYVLEFFRNFYQKKNGIPYLEPLANSYFESTIINYIRLHGSEKDNFIPKDGETFIYIRTKSTLGYVGLNESNANGLGNLMFRYVDDILSNDVAIYSSLPGISITEAILAVLARYDISSYRTDSFRRKHDRRTKETTVQKPIDIVTINHRVNSVLKNVYNEKFVKLLEEK